MITDTIEEEDSLRVNALLEDFLTDYCYCLDDWKVDKWPAFFADNAKYTISTRENHDRGYEVGIVLCDGIGMIRDRVKAMKTANIFEQHTYCHILSKPRFRRIKGDQYSARTNFTVFRTKYTGESELFAAGKYEDRISCESRNLKLLERNVILDSRQVDILLVLPL